MQRFSRKSRGSQLGRPTCFLERCGWRSAPLTKTRCRRISTTSARSLRTGAIGTPQRNNLKSAGVRPPTYRWRSSSRSRPSGSMRDRHAQKSWGSYPGRGSPMPTAMHRRSMAPGSGTKTTRADGMPIVMISMMPSTSLVGTQTCRTNPKVSQNGILTISISPITKGRLAGVGGHTIKTAGSKNRRGK